MKKIVGSQFILILALICMLVANKTKPEDEYFPKKYLESPYSVVELDDVFWEVMCGSHNVDVHGCCSVSCPNGDAVHISHHKDGCSLWTKFAFMNTDDAVGTYCVPCGYPLGMDWNMICAIETA